MKHRILKPISIFLIFVFLWQEQPHSTYAVENGCLRPLAVGEGKSRAARNTTSVSEGRPLGAGERRDELTRGVEEEVPHRNQDMHQIVQVSDASLLRVEQLLTLVSNEQFEYSEIPMLDGVVSVYIVAIPSENAFFKFSLYEHLNSIGGYMMVSKIDENETDIGDTNIFQWFSNNDPPGLLAAVKQIEYILKDQIKKSKGHASASGVTAQPQPFPVLKQALAAI